VVSPASSRDSLFLASFDKLKLDQNRLRFEVEAKAGSGKERILMKKVFVIAIALTLVLSAMAFAGNNPDAKVAVHVMAHSAKRSCTNLFPTIAGCADIVTDYGDYSVDAFPVFFDLQEYLGCEYALCWPDWAYSAAFTSCSDFFLGGIAWPGDGASHTWTVCQYGVALPGWVWLYADGPGTVCPCPHPDFDHIAVLDCAEGLDNPICIFCAGVYGMIGDDPCEPTGTAPSTWSEIKGMFE